MAILASMIRYALPREWAPNDRTRKCPGVRMDIIVEGGEGELAFGGSE